MIASPGDVEEERLIARHVIYEWNAINSEDKALVLMPISWETHSTPSMDGRAQEVINRQVLTDCDLLVAIFWTRIGTPTGESASGTVEEINEHIQAAKPAMIYFSSAPVKLEDVDSDQYSALKKFREDLKTRGLIEGYESVSEFRTKFTRHLAQKVIRDFDHLFKSETSQLVDHDYSSSQSISQDAQELLISAVRDGNGDIYAFRSVRDLSVQVKEKQFVEEGNPRSQARWQKAIEELVKAEYIRDQGYKGEQFEVTADGYDAADALMPTS
jgi:hypothetical protein